MECNYDGGDCCGDNINSDYCTECLCLDDSGVTAPPLTIETIGGMFLIEAKNRLSSLSRLGYCKYVSTEKVGLMLKTLQDG